MIRRTSTILLVSLLIVAVLTMPAIGAHKKDKVDKRLVVSRETAMRAATYALADEGYLWQSTSQGGEVLTTAGRPVGNMTLAGGSVSPGTDVGNTWYDYQHNGSIGRMVSTGPHSGETGATIVHFAWMYAPDRAVSWRSYAYAAYNSDNHAQLSPVYLPTEAPTGEAKSGFVNCDVTPDNRAIVGGHCLWKESLGGNGLYFPEFFFDGGPAYATFPNSERIPDSTALWNLPSDPTYGSTVNWPRMFFQLGTDTVFHVAASEGTWNLSGPQAIIYFRKVGFEGSDDYEWDYPPYHVDTNDAISQDVVGQRNGDKICLTWFATLPYDEPDCDTCSAPVSFYDGWLIGQKDNDFYYQQSEDQGVTFSPRVNVTKIPIGGKAYKAYCDATTLYDSYGNLHVAWNAIPWAADTCLRPDEGFCFAESWNEYLNVRLMHWSENVPYIRPIADQTQDVNDLEDSCYASDWSIRIAKMSLAQCDTNLYCIWSQFNNPKEGIIDDCAEWGYELNGYNAANADIYVSVSEDWGMTWDYQRNLTNTYTPRCDPTGGEDCMHDYYPSMNYMGRQVDVSEDWSGAVVVDPSGGAYTGDWYLDIQYINDLCAGSVVRTYGEWTDNPVKWFRMPCVDPVPLPILVASWKSFGDPSYCKPGESLDSTLLLENVGNVELTYTMTIEYDSCNTGDPCPEGWLSTSGFSGSIPSGLEGEEYGTVHVNQTNMSAYGNYYGRLHFEGNDPNNLPMDIPVELIIADTIVSTKYDSVNTNCLGLICGTDGNYGRNGWGELNMDYYPDDCDTEATIYLYEGTPIVGWLEGDDTVITNSIWGGNYINVGFRPQGGEIARQYCPVIGAEVFHTGTITTQDSTVALSRILFAPSTEDCNFIVQYLKVWSYDSAPHSGLVIGEAVDWDIPTDYPIGDTLDQIGAANTGGFDATRNLIYIQGFEKYGADGEDTTYPYNCQYNDARYGGQAMLASYLNGSLHSTAAYGGFTTLNGPMQTVSDGYHPGRLYERMTVPGFGVEEELEDVSAVLTYEFDYDLGATDVLEIISVLATVHEGTEADLQTTVDNGAAWFAANGGMDMFVDLDTDGEIDVCKYCCNQPWFGQFYNHEGDFNLLDIDNFIEWLLRDPGGPEIYSCAEQVDVSGATAGTPDGSIDILDIDYMISYLLRQTVPDLGSCPPME